MRDTALFHDVASGTTDVDADSAPAPELPFGTDPHDTNRFDARFRDAGDEDLGERGQIEACVDEARCSGTVVAGAPEGAFVRDAPVVLASTGYDIDPTRQDQRSTPRLKPNSERG